MQKYAKETNLNATDTLFAIIYISINSGELTKKGNHVQTTRDIQISSHIHIHTYIRNAHKHTAINVGTLGYK